MFGRRQRLISLLAAVIALVFAFVLLSGGLFHSLVPHDHGPLGEETSIWTALHASLQHEHKEFFILPILIALYAAALLQSAAVRRTFYLYFEMLVRERDSGREALRRGIVRYRKFG